VSDDPAAVLDGEPDPSTDADPDPDPDAPGDRESVVKRLDPLGVLVGSIVGVAGLLFLAYPSVGRVPVAGAEIPAFVLAAGVLGLGFAVGAVGFRRRGRGRLAAGHAVGALAWLALFAGGSVGSQVLVIGGVVAVIAGALFAADALRRR
jgi:hypothetical protein